MTIGIVDDDDIYRFTIMKTIQALNLSAKILVFTDGEQALDYITKNIGNDALLPSVILLDVNMPVLDGFGFMSEYSKLIPELPNKINIFMISSSINPADVNRAKSIPEVTDYIVKPIVVGKLVRIFADLERKGYL